MKQYTNESQTAKLVELGFKKPNGLEFLIREQDNPDNAQIVQRMAYSIGELIEMLPPKIEAEMADESDDEYAWLSFEEGWDVLYRSGYDIVERVRHSKELIDALYDMAVQLKVEGVI